MWSDKMNIGTVNLAPKLRRAMRRANVTQAALARRVDVGRSTVSAWVHGKAKPRLDTLDRIARVLGTTVPDLLEAQ